MPYLDVSALSTDPDFSARCMACYALEHVGIGTSAVQDFWTQHAWDLAAQPGFGDAYASALANPEVEYPGRDQAVISDDQILAAVQSLNPANEGNPQ